MNIRHKLMPDISGIFWFCQNELSLEDPHFNDLDYIFNGLLSKNLLKETSTLPSLFFTESFSKKIFLYHYPLNLKPEVITKSFEIIAKNNLETRKFIVVDDTNENWIKYLEKKHSNYTFIN